ncbi:MAG: hypothetical protein ACRBF0_15355 [Calditrichia bacterium]
MPTNNLEHKSQLIENAYFHRPVHAADRLTVIEGPDGLSEILSSGTDGKLYLLKQDSSSDTGWSQLDQQCPIPQTCVAALTSSDGKLHLAVADEKSLEIATRVRSEAGVWGEWIRIPAGNSVAGEARFYELDLHERSDGSVEFFLLYLQRFKYPWNYTYRIGHSLLSAENWQLRFQIDRSFSGWWPTKLPSMTPVINGTQQDLYLFIPEIKSLVAWDGIDGATSPMRTVTTLTEGFLPKIIGLTHDLKTTVYAAGTIGAASGLFQLNGSEFQQIGSVELVDLDGTVDDVGIVNIVGVDSTGSVWHTSKDSEGTFFPLREITDKALRASATLTETEGPVFILTGIDLQLSRYLRSPQQTDWELENIETESTASEWVMWYNTRSTVTDNLKQAVAGYPVTIQAEETTILSVNGKTLVVGPFQQLSLETDGNGLLVFMQPAEELANLWVPKLNIRLAGDAAGTWHTISAAAATSDRMYNLTGQELRTATGRNGAKVLPAGEDANADALAAQISTCASIGRSKPNHGQFTIPDYEGNPEHLPEFGFAHFTALDGSLNERFDIHDVFESIKEGILGVIGLAIETVVEGGLVKQLVVTINTVAGEFKTVISIISQGFNVIRAIFEEVKIVFETALEWLGYLFDWEKILQRKDEIAAMITEGIASLPQKIADSGIKDKIPETFAQLRTGAPAGIATFQTGIGQDTLGSAADSIDLTTLGDIINAIDDTIMVPVTWLFDRLAPILPDSSLITASMDGGSWDQLTTFFNNVQGQVSGDVQVSIDNITAVMESVFMGDNPNALLLNDLIDAFKPRMDGILTAFEHLSLEALTNLEGLAEPDSLTAFLNSSAKLPLFSEVLALINNQSGELPFTILDFAAMIAAIPVHIIETAVGGPEAINVGASKCDVWIVAGVFLLMVGLFSGIAHILEEAGDGLSSMVPLFWIFALIPLAILVDWSEVIQVLAVVFYTIYQVVDLVLIRKAVQNHETGMAIFGFLIAIVLNIMAAIYERDNEVPTWQIVANHVGSITDFARVADLKWKPPKVKPKPARVILTIIDALGMGSLAASAFAEYHFCANPPPTEPA